MSGEDRRVCADCGDPLAEDDFCGCDQCEVDLCESCAFTGMTGDDSYQTTHCSSCRNERERLQVQEEKR